jgi:hypothetical protein
MPEWFMYALIAQLDEINGNLRRMADVLADQQLTDEVDTEPERDYGQYL